MARIFLGYGEGVGSQSFPLFYFEVRKVCNRGKEKTQPFIIFKSLVSLSYIV